MGISKFFTLHFLKNASWIAMLIWTFEPDLQDTVDWGSLLISMLEKLNWFHLTGLITLVLLMWKWMGLFLRKNHLLRCWGWPSLLNWIEALILSLLLKLLPRKLELWFILWSFFLLRFLCISINLPSDHAWNTVATPSCYLELLDKLQKQICRTVGPSLAASLELLAHRQNVACLSLFYQYPHIKTNQGLIKINQAINQQISEI